MRDGELFRGVFCFEGFEVDVRSGELRKLGTRIKFQDQPLRLLTLLIEHQGEVVTREELRAKLWPADTFVDFDHGLNSAVARVREVLNDSAATPRFIETIPKRGYRFLAPVEVRGALPELRVAAITSSSEEKSDPVKDWNQWLGWLVVIGCLLAVIVFAGMEMVRPKAFAPPKIARTVQLTNDGQLKGTSASDGIRLYFVEKIAEKFLLKQVSVHGGVVSTVNPSWGPIYIYELSPNRSELLAGAEIKLEATPLFTIELPSGLPHKLNPWANAACWMRDGLHIAYAQGKEIYQASIDGSNANRIATVGGDVSNLSASPDGARLRFTTSDNESGALELTELSLKDGTVTSLTPSWKGVARPCCGVWSPDGRYYYFQTRLESKYLDGDIWVLPGASGKGQRIAETALTHGPLALGKLSVDPNGRTLYARGMLPRAQLVRYDSCSASLLPFLGGISASDVDISKDRQWVTYVSYPESVLWRSRLDGSQQLRLSFGKIEA